MNKTKMKTGSMLSLAFAGALVAGAGALSPASAQPAWPNETVVAMTAADAAPASALGGAAERQQDAGLYDCALHDMHTRLQRRACPGH